VLPPTAVPPLITILQLAGAFHVATKSRTVLKIKYAAMIVASRKNPPSPIIAVGEVRL